MHGCAVVVTGIGLCPDYHRDPAEMLVVPPLAETNTGLASRLPGERGLKYAPRESLLLAIAAKQALEDAKIDPHAVNADRAGIAISTATGGLNTFATYYQTLTEQGLRYVNPMDSPYLLYNGAASQLGIRTGFTSFNVTFSSGITGLVDSLAFAAAAMENGLADLALVGGAEARGEWSDRAWNAMAGKGEQAFSEGAALLVLETADHAAARGVCPYCQLEATANSSGDRRTGFASVVAQVLQVRKAGHEAVEMVALAIPGNPESQRSLPLLQELFPAMATGRARLRMCNDAGAASSYALAELCRSFRGGSDGPCRLGLMLASDPAGLHGAVLVSNV